MRRARRNVATADEHEEPLKQRRRAAGLNAAPATVEAAPAPAAPERRVTRQQARAQAAAAAAAAAAEPRFNRVRSRARAAAEAPAGPVDDQQQQLEEQEVQEEPGAAGSDREYDEGESAYSDGEDEEVEEESDGSNDRAVEVVRQLGLMPPGAESEEEGEGTTEEEDEYEDHDEFEDGFEDEDEWDEQDDFIFGPPAVLPGGPGWDIVVGVLPGTPARARGGALQPLPGDQQVTEGVWAREQPDKHHILFGQALANCPKLLSRVFKMRQQPGQLVWKCDLELTEREWQYIKNVFAHDRLRPLLQLGRRVLAPLPDYGFPQRFRPVDSTGQLLKGPHISRNGKPWNMGRQFFSTFRQGDDSSFIWADGVKAMEAEAQQSFREEMLGDGLYGLFGF